MMRNLDVLLSIYVQCQHVGRLAGHSYRRPAVQFYEQLLRLNLLVTNLNKAKVSGDILSQNIGNEGNSTLLVKNSVDASTSFFGIPSYPPRQHEIGVALYKNLRQLVAGQGHSRNPLL